MYFEEKNTKSRMIILRLQWYYLKYNEIKI